MPTAPETKRKARAETLRAKAAAVAASERELEAAIAARDKALIAAHGDRRSGGLSYGEMAEAVGLGRGRVIQIVQGKSEFSKRQTRAAR